MLLAIGICCQYACDKDPIQEEKQATSFEVKIACLSDQGLPGLEFKIEMDDGTAYVVETDQNGIATFDENLGANCYNIRLEKFEDKGPEPNDLDKAALSAYLQNPSASNRPAVVYDLNRDLQVDAIDMADLDELIGDLENGPNYPWTFVLTNGSADLTCLTAEDFENQLQIIAYRLSDFDGSECD